MSREQRDNSGAVFKNERKQKDTHPDRTGSAMIGGVEYWVSGWLKTCDKGPFLSLAFKPKEERQRQQPASSAMPSNSEMGMDEPPPF